MNTSKVKLGGRFDIICYQADGSIRWEESIDNLVVQEGINHILNVIFHDISKASGWYIGLIKTAIVVADGDTLASHAGWTECTEYADNRKAYTVVDATAKSITNSASPATFVMNDGVTVKGAFICSAETGTSGVLMCGAASTQGDRAVLSGDNVNVTYTLSLADDGA